MSKSGGGEIPAEETSPSKTGIDEETGGMEGDDRGNSSAWSAKIVCVVLSCQVPHLKRSC